MNSELELVISIAKAAGAMLASHYGKSIAVDFKQDEFDPVTQADKESDEYIRRALADAFPDDDILSEENEARPNSYSHRVWMVDPLDGTKDFVGGRPSFAVMIGLLDKNVPVLGVIFNPITEELFYAAKGKGAYRKQDGQTTRLQVSSNNNLAKAVLITRNQVDGDVRPLDTQVNSLNVASRQPEGSIGLKLGRISQGQADAFVHTNTHGCKWDTLAGQVLLEEAGGVIADLTGNKLDYTKPTVGWDRYFVAANNRLMLKQLLDQVDLP